MSREPHLESAVMEILWNASQPLTPSQVHAELKSARAIAYTTVLTAVSRLWKKGLLTRTRRGRTYTYLPREGRADSAARRMEELLAATRERNLTLARFIDNLSASDRRELRRFLEHE
ncbi:MAG: BlaI/MecI/CopY family transcriptional regulator [Actinomycetota bacterium]|nr:BlaI/MecI/CopY family transcriptional regulator [Actinomycetota bacterium]